MECAGKSCSIQFIRNFFHKNGINNVIFTREPGSTTIAEELRIILNKKFSNETLTKKAELLIIYAARAQLIEKVIRPALFCGNWIISDRFDLSSQAYQGGGRKLNKFFLSKIRRFVLNKINPDLTIYLDISLKTLMKRIISRGKKDRIENESIQFFKRVRLRYKLLAKNNRNIVSIDANQPKIKVHKLIKRTIMKKFNL